MLSSTFEGSTGVLAWGETRRNARSRRRQTMTFGVQNIRKLSKPDPDTGMTHASYFTHVLQGGAADGSGGKWTEVSGNSAFLYSNAETTAPVLLRNQPDRNYLSTGVRAFGLSMMSLSLLFCAASALLVFWYRKSGMIKAGQPIFLSLLILGAMTMSLAMLTQSFDENSGWSVGQLNAACAATPWLVSVGYLLIYCTLFSKLWRINRVMQFSKRTVELKHVLAPFVIMVIAALAILTAWTVDDPYQWERSVINDETGETAGKCESGKTLEYVTPLTILMALSTIMTAVMAWKTKDIEDKYSESKWIFYTIAMQVQMLIVGLPVVAILQDDSSTNASYLMRVMLIWTVPVSTTLLIFCPKAVGIFFTKNNKKKARSGGHGGTVQISGLTNGIPIVTPQSSYGNSAFTRSTLNSVPSTKSEVTSSAAGGVSESIQTDEAPPATSDVKEIKMDKFSDDGEEGC